MFADMKKRKNSVIWCVFFLVGLVLVPTAVFAEWVPFSDGAQEGSPEIQVLESNSRKVTLDITVPGMNVTQDGDAQRLAIPGGTHLTNVSMPLLPMINHDLELPFEGDLSNMKVEVAHCESDILSNYKVFANQPYAPDNSLYPAEPIGYIGPYGTMLRLQIYPVQYNSAQQTLKIHSHILVEISKDASQPQTDQYGDNIYFSPPQIFEIPGGGHRVEMDGTQPDNSVPGAPILPRRRMDIFVPPGHQIQDIEVRYGDFEDIEGEYDVEFAELPIPISYEGPIPEANPDGDIYSRDSNYPGISQNPAYNIQRLHGVQIAQVDVHPVQYNPYHRALSYTPNVQVILLAEKLDNPPENPIPFRNTPEIVQKIKDIIDNDEEFDNFVQDIPPAPIPDISREYVVITSADMVSTFQELTDYRETSHGGGFSTYIETVENIAVSYSGRDLAEKMRNFIIECYTHYNTQYVVLGGDCDGTLAQQAIPTRGTYAAVPTINGIEEDENIPSDLYFACLDGSWNSDNDNRWGEENDGEAGGDIDWLAEVYVGRISADNADEAANHINKIILYETIEGRQKTLMLGENLASDPLIWGGDRLDWVHEHLINMEASKLYDRDGVWNSNELVELININDYNWINHLGHSNPVSNMKLHHNDVESMSNQNYFLVYSQGCYAGSLDGRWSSGNYSDSDCMGEILTNGYSSSGAFAYIGNSRYGWYNQSHVDKSSNRFHKQFVEAVTQQGYERIGVANQKSKESLSKDTGVHRWISFETNLIGDPASDIFPTPVKVTLSGYVRQPDNSGIQGVVLEGLPGDPVSDESGYYSAEVDFGWSGEVTPQMNGMAFSPENRSYDTVTENMSGQNYTRLPVISGYVLDLEGNPVADVVLQGFPGGPVVTDANGYYQASVAIGWSGAIVPQKSGTEFFEPESFSYQNVSTDAVDQSYQTLSLADRCSEATIVFTGQDGGKWSNPSNWEPAEFGRPNENDIVKIPVGKSVVANGRDNVTGNLTSPDWVKGICNHGTIITLPGGDLILKAKDFIYNAGEIIGEDGIDGGCSQGINDCGNYEHAKDGSSVHLHARFVVNEGTIAGGNGGKDSTWHCLNNVDYADASNKKANGVWDYFIPLGFRKSIPDCHRDEELEGGSRYDHGFPTIGGNGGNVKIYSDSEGAIILDMFINRGIIQGGQGGYADSAEVEAWIGSGVAGLTLGGDGGDVLVSVNQESSWFNESGNVDGGELRAGNGGNADIFEHYEDGDSYDDDNNCPSSPGFGGEVRLNGGLLDGGVKGQTIYWEPNTLQATSNTRIESSGIIEIFGGDNWIMDLRGLTEGAVTAEKRITIAVGEGATVDLRGLNGTVFSAGDRIEIFADNILLDEGVSIEDLAESPEIVVEGAKILYRASLTAPTRLEAEEGTSVTIPVKLLNSGPKTDTYSVNLISNLQDWEVSGLPETVTVEGLQVKEFNVSVTLPPMPGELNYLTLEAVSQANPETSVRAVTRLFTRLSEEDLKDPDEDDLPNYKESYRYGTDPDQFDTDQDGMDDGWEIRYFLKALKQDANEDPDGDGFTNIEEYEADTDPTDPESHPDEYTAGLFIVDESGQVRVDYLFDGGAYEGELGLFSLSDMEGMAFGSAEFISEAVRRVRSDSLLGAVVIQDSQEGARFSGQLGSRQEPDFNLDAGKYRGIKTVEMTPGDKLAAVLIPNGTFAELAQNPSLSDPKKQPLFSLATANPQDGLFYGQVAGVNPQGCEFANAVAFEDMCAADSDRDYNDVVFQIRGVEVYSPTLDGLIAEGQMDPADDWRVTEEEGIGDHLCVPAPDPDTLWLTFTLKSPADLLVYDPAGRVIGKDGGEIPGASFQWDENGHQVITVPSLESGEYTIVLRAIGDGGLCHLEVRGFEGDTEIMTQEKPLVIEPHQVLKTTVDATSFVDYGEVYFDPPQPPQANGRILRFDYDGDGDIDESDIARVSELWGICEGDASYDPFYDLDDSGCIDFYDVTAVANAYYAGE